MALVRVHSTRTQARFVGPIGAQRGALAAAFLILGALAGCSGSGSSGPSGPGIHIELTEVAGSRIGGGEVLGAGGSGTDKFSGDLTESGDDTWKGVLAARIDQDRETMVLGSDCKTHIVGTQQVDAVLTKGSFGGEYNATLVLSPKAAPSYSSADKCTTLPGAKASNGIEWLTYFVSDYQGTPVKLHLADAPGGSWEQTIGDPNGTYVGDELCSFLQPLAECYRHTTFKVTYRN